MRRKLIKQDAFERITNESVIAKEQELVEAGELIAKALGKEQLSLHSFTESTVLYETLDKTYVHAGYEINNGHITFNNVEELVVDEQSRKDKRKSHLSEMIDELLQNNDTKAKDHFNSYMEMVNWIEAKKIADIMAGKEDDECCKKPSPFQKKSKKNPFDKKDDKKDKKRSKKDKEAFLNKAKDAGKEIEEAYITAINVLDYVDYTKFGPSVEEMVTKEDDKGNITDIRIPVTKIRNEGKVLQMGFDTMTTKLITHAKKGKKLAENQEFCKAMAELRKQNALSDSQALENVLEGIVKDWPVVLYVTQDDLAQVIGEALNTLNVTNYDDKTCTFMAEGILRKAHDAYSEKVAQILHLAQASQVEEGQDPYIHFQSVVGQFYPRLDEEFGLERKAFEDLYHALETIWKKADRRGDESLKRESAGYLNELAAVLNEQVKPDVAIVEEAANWLANLVETNLKMGTWNVSNKPHMTQNGDHPDMNKKASQGYSPSADGTGDWGDPAPMISQDNMSYKGGAAGKARSSAWGNLDGLEPNTTGPKPFGDYTMKGEKGVDKDTFGQHHGSWQSKDTWPALQNPYIPKDAKIFKMKNGSETDLVIDK